MCPNAIKRSGTPQTELIGPREYLSVCPRKTASLLFVLGRDL